MATRCQRIGCDATFTEDDNADGSCRYHDSYPSLQKVCFLFSTRKVRCFLCGTTCLTEHCEPMFHDGMKEWSCCKQRSHDFNLFLAIPGCKTGKHTAEKPVTRIVSASPQKSVPSSAQVRTTNDLCSRCRQGFFCSDHGSQAKPSKPAVPVSATNDLVKKTPAPVKKIVSLDELQTCRNKGCGKTFKEKDNHESACEYHPGPPVFRDRIRGWKCCDVHVKEFDEFMSILPCTKGWHSADAA